MSGSSPKNENKRSSLKAQKRKDEVTFFEESKVDQDKKRKKAKESNTVTGAWGRPNGRYCETASSERCRLRQVDRPRRRSDSARRGPSIPAGHMPGARPSRHGYRWQESAACALCARHGNSHRKRTGWDTQPGLCRVPGGGEQTDDFARPKK